MRNQDVSISLKTLIWWASAALVCTAGCQSAPKSPEPERVTKVAAPPVAVKLLAPDDPSNPYKGQYREWDLWLAQHEATEQVAFLDGKRPEKWVSLSTCVDRSGAIVPLLEASRILHEGLAHGNEAYYKDLPYRVRGEGEMEPALYQQYMDEETSLMASYFPPIPEWLAANPPRESILVPSGEVVTLGLLGSGFKKRDPANPSGQQSCCGGSGEQYWIYSSTGEPLESAKGHWWWNYYERNNPRVNEEMGNFNCSRRDGVIYFTKPGTEEIASVWTWDGKRLPGTTLPPLADSAPFVHLTASQLAPLRKFQLNPIHKEQANGR
jgi:hypothetical protein